MSTETQPQVTDTTNTTTPATAPVAPTQAQAQAPMIVEERLLAAAYINQAIQKDGLLPYVIVMSGLRYGGVIRSLIAWAPKDAITPESVASAMGLEYDPKQGDFIHIELITSANALIGIPDVNLLTVVRSSYQVQQQATQAPAEATSAADSTATADSTTTSTDTTTTSTDTTTSSAAPATPADTTAPSDTQTTAPADSTTTVQHVSV